MNYTIYKNQLLSLTTITSECWIFNSSKNKKGYGRISISFKETKTKKSFYAHRLSYLIYKGDIPEKMLVCHTCDNSSCINPDHLFLGTNKDNVFDMITKGRRPSFTCEKNSMAKTTKEQVLEMRSKFSNGKYTQKDLAEEYKLDKSTVGSILRQETWNF